MNFMMKKFSSSWWIFMMKKFSSSWWIFHHEEIFIMKKSSSWWIFHHEEIFIMKKFSSSWWIFMMKKFSSSWWRWASKKKKYAQYCLTVKSFARPWKITDWVASSAAKITGKFLVIFAQFRSTPVGLFHMCAHMWKYGCSWQFADKSRQICKKFLQFFRARFLILWDQGMAFFKFFNFLKKVSSVPDYRKNWKWKVISLFPQKVKKCFSYGRKAQKSKLKFKGDFPLIS